MTDLLFLVEGKAAMHPVPMGRATRFQYINSNGEWVHKINKPMTAEAHKLASGIKHEMSFEKDLMKPEV
jgi:hypothetical protein